MRATHRHRLCLGLALLAVACQPEIPAVSGKSVAKDGAAVDGERYVIAGDATSSDGWPTDSEPPVVSLQLSPSSANLTGKFTLTGQVTDDTGVASATVKVGDNVPTHVALDGDGRFSMELLVPYGVHVLRVRAWDLGGLEGGAQIKAERVGAPDDGTPPSLKVLSPKPGFEVSGNSVLVHGQASDDVSLKSVTVRVGDGPPVLAETEDFFATWRLTAGLSVNGAVQLFVTATDVSGKSVTVSVTGSTSLQFDTVPPLLEVYSPQTGDTTASGAMELKGSAQDASGVEAVHVRVNQGPFLAVTSLDGFKTFSSTLALQPGVNLVKVRARDKAGLISDVSLAVKETSGDQWTDPVVFPLRVQPNKVKPQTFSLSKGALATLFPPEKSSQIVTLEMSVDALIKGTLQKIRDACGSGWEKPNNLDKKCPKAWGQQEINLWRLVTMTPANVKVAGTSIAGMAEIASTLSQWGLMDNFSTILAAGLGIKTTDLIVGSEAVAASMVDNIVATHPQTNSKGQIRVTLEDCLTDLSSLSKRYGPSGEHPGFLDPSAPPKSVVLTDEFEMKLTATSNLRWHDGVRLGVGKSYLAMVQDTTGPTFDDVLEFNFLDPKTYQVTGVAAAPTVDLTFRVLESNQWIDVGSSRYPLPKGNSKGWSLKPWFVEHALLDAAWRDYKNHRVGCDLCGGKSSGALLWEVPILGLDEAELVVGRQGYSKGGGKPEHFKKIDPNPAGWMRVWTLFGLGSPPPDQYVWDMILGVSQRRLLDGGVAQGQGSVRFSLKDVPIGLTGEELKDKLRPSMQAQRKKLASLLMGPWENDSPVDLFVKVGLKGQRWLMFVAPADPLPPASLKHPKRGFYADAKLTQKVSTTASLGSGDTVHEKVPWPIKPVTWYVGDALGSLHRLQVNPQPDGTLWVTMRAWKSKVAP